MHCTQCGKGLPEGAAHCPFCGQAAATQPPPPTALPPSETAAPTAPPQAFCVKCGNTLVPNASFCTLCGAQGVRPGEATTPATSPRRLCRSKQDRWISGVAGGLAEYLNAPTWLIRTLFVVTGLLYGLGVIPYVVLWLIMPEEKS
jgi:phage shock protein C